MKNSAWYQKLWRKKLDELPVQQDSKSSWTNMKKLLDEHMPEINTVGRSSDKPFGTSIVSLLSYLIPLIAIISATVYFYVPQYMKPQNIQNQKTKQQMHLDTPKHDKISFDSTHKNIVDINNLPLKNNRIVEYSNATIYPNKQGTTIGRAETTALNSATKIKALTGNNSLPKVFSAKKTTLISSNMLIPFVSVKKRNRFQTNSIVKTGTKLNVKPTDSVDKITSKDRYLNGKNADEYSKTINRRSITQDSANKIAKFKQVPTIATIVQKNKNQLKANSKSNVKQSKNTAKGKKANAFFSPTYNFSLEIGVNTSNNVSFYFSGVGSYALNNRWLVNAGIRINSYKRISGEYLHPSYYRPDSLPSFKIIDSRKLLVLDIPLNLEYRISKTISLRAGPVISLSLKQKNISSKLGTIADLRDTVYHSKEINKALNNTNISKVSFGFTGGISFHVNQFDLNSNYQLLTPYKISNDLGAYRKANNTFQVSIAYRFK
ncbi:MAG: hypothetical protein V5804_11540 [Mucilaginibacter sp.]|uniref:hypothetical protein n=1 Tax=Mucilaginibacter sp. TaxID=1882438 RepID=UPI0034E4C28F